LNTSRPFFPWVAATPRRCRIIFRASGTTNCIHREELVSIVSLTETMLFLLYVLSGERWADTLESILRRAGRPIEGSASYCLKIASLVVGEREWLVFGLREVVLIIQG
jgi:hypothetical protein